jgi:Family of unknown function (DUF6077)
METADRAAAAFARVSDGVLDFVVLAFAAWTVVYHVCLLAGIGTLPAGIAGALILVPCGWAVVRFGDRPGTANEPDREEWSLTRTRRPAFLLAGQAALALIAAAVFAFTSVDYSLSWLLFFVAALGGLALTLLRAEPRLPAGEDRTRWPSALTALGWGLGLAGLSLFLIRSSGDDAYYVHLSAWVAAHGDFPLRDTMFTDQALPAVIYPPVASFEGLIGALAQLAGLQAATVTYYVVPPVASFLAVLAVWRCLRAWGTPFVAGGLSVAMAFLLLDGAAPHSFGNLFVGRIWQGKIVLLAVLLPLAWAHLTRYALRPSRPRLVILGALGVAGVGLTSTAIFVLPVLAFGTLVVVARRKLRPAVAAFAAISAYPLLAGVVVYAVGGRHAQGYTDRGVVSSTLAHDVLGKRWLALVAVLAALLGPVLLRRVVGARMAASLVLLLVLLYAPGVPKLLFHATGLGAVLWRLVWVIPVAALAGAAVSAIALRFRSPLPVAGVAAAAIALLLVVGVPLWDAPGPQRIVARPALKMPPGDVTIARRILAGAEPGDLILAPKRNNPALLVLSGDTTSVVARPFYAIALRRGPGGHWQERLLLAAFAQNGLGPVEKRQVPYVDDVTATKAIKALRDLDVDLACVKRKASSATAALREAGYGRPFRAVSLLCFRKGSSS